MAGMFNTISRLQTAINKRGGRILYSTSQFYSEDKQKPITCYLLKLAYLDEETGRTESSLVFKTYSQLQVVLFLRDYLCLLSGTKLPTDNEAWNKVRDTISLFKKQ